MKFFYPEDATPIDDISGLKPNWVRTQEELNQVEAENVSDAIDKYLIKAVKLPQSWFNVPTLNEIHRAMFFDVWDWAGKFRTAQTIPGLKPYQIPEALESLCRDVQFWCSKDSGMAPIEQAAQVHHRLVWIHPYPNGNGRFSRLVADRYLKAWKCKVPYWPTDLGENGQHRKDYIAALKKGDRGDYKPLVLYMMKCGAK
ncbi:mobile mystery protein B [Candidatus Neptunochlamydia vexilliferae]|uniref:Fido domain-containing protein n=1 Tax=Candidatus Neptunichlamydia vexilliferae TaxID=1651774 RepID=A0ABS0AXE4_9BACT|nr:mobile mystery protein B [Candidatus Neptunochlamydia vexilliferae]MBF5058793.1 hypothetical protein [Candidatus Neptunochlamydia vexilliferae]